MEIPIIWSIIKKQEGPILEIGNVLSHYFAFQHDIVDKYEKGDYVINEDVIDLQLQKKYDLIVSISTIEHVGWDENPLDKNQKLNVPEKTLQAIENLKRFLKPNGLLFLTFPVGANPHLDTLVKSKKIKFVSLFCMKRVSKDNRWVETEWTDIQNLEYGKPFPLANGLVIGVINA